jgi:hypothetical protein
MLGQPVAAEPEALRVLGERDRVAERRPRVAAFDNRRQVENGERDRLLV